MNNLRFDALKKIAQQTSDRFNQNPNRLECFADHVLTDQKLSHYLSKTAFTEMTKASMGTTHKPFFGRANCAIYEDMGA